ncbi:hypothetical protein B0H13DRAFT_2300675 [Mycena leptocephala]|nr:hypothetical protein B0H13DRAFT_2300675 [Mycena leptocephala]
MALHLLLHPLRLLPTLDPSTACTIFLATPTTRHDLVDGMDLDPSSTATPCDAAEINTEARKGVRGHVGTIQRAVEER